jgi:cell division protein FtsI/penicillin-binding protein 2
VDLGGNNNPPWEYDGTLPLRLIGGMWKVHWSPSVLHPKLREGERFAVIIESKGRQHILDRNGDPLQDEQTLYVAGVYPSRLKDAAKVCEQLAKVTGFPEDRLLSRIRSAPPKQLVQLVTFGRAKYAQLRDKLRAIPGITIFTDDQPVAPAPPVQIIGQVNAVTPETEQQLGGPERAGDTVGRNGLQKAYQDQLTSSTETRVVTLDDSTGEQIAELASWPGRANTPVKTTIDRAIQVAAELSVSGSGPVALVAVKASTGEILAVATEDLHQERDALAGRFPAGTTFSVVASGGLLKAGVDPGRKVPCTADRSVGGARFQQRSGAAGPTPTFAADFAHGCVTALASTARLVDSATLAASATSFGIGAPWSLPLRSFSGWTPAGRTDAEKAKIITGQSVKVSPLSMALVAGAVATGTWRPPKLVTSPALPDPGSGLPAPTTSPPVRLDPGMVTKLKAMMRAGVTSGTARLAASGKDPVYGVASEVVYTEKKQRTDLSWFVGWQGDLAVAVMAEKSDPGVASAVAGGFFAAARTVA